MVQRFGIVIFCLWLSTATVACVPQRISAAPAGAPIALPSVPTAQRPVTATPDASFTPTTRDLSIPTMNPTDRQAGGATLLYLSFFQSFEVSIIDPQSSHALKAIRTQGDRAGVAVSPDGARLYVVDGGIDGVLRVYDTATWNVIHSEVVPEFATLFQNPIALSGDGRWLIIAHLSASRVDGWTSLFDTRNLRMLAHNPLDLDNCHEFKGQPIRLIGHQRSPRLLAQCEGYIAALDAGSLARQWRVKTPRTLRSDLCLSPDGKHLLGLYPHVVSTYSFPDGHGRVVETDLVLLLWEPESGRLLQQIRLSDQVSIPAATFGRGNQGYLQISPDGSRLFVVWENRVWELEEKSLHVIRELRLPFPVDGVAQSVDGRELYLLPSTVGDLQIRAYGLWTVNTEKLQLERHASDWPPLDLFDVTFQSAPGP